MPKSRHPTPPDTVDRWKNPIDGIDKPLIEAILPIEHNLGSNPGGLPSADFPDDVFWMLSTPGPGLSSGRFLTVTETEDGKRYKHPGRYRQWMQGRATAKYLLIHQAKPLELSVQSSADIEILRNPNGWPQLQDKTGQSLPVSLTISHTNDLVFSAVCRERNGHIGADIELIALKTPSMLEDFYTVEERDGIHSLSSANQALAATLIWSAKESVLKAMKTGLMENTKTIRIAMEETTFRPENNWRRTQAVLNRQQSIPVWWRVFPKHNVCVTLVRI